MSQANFEAWQDFRRGELWTPAPPHKCVDCGRPASADIVALDRPGGKPIGHVCEECWDRAGVPLPPEPHRGHVLECPCEEGTGV
jgi:hypothetical protein